MKKLSSLVLIGLLLFILAPEKLWAVEGIGITPAIQEVNLEEDQESVTFSVGISNLSSNAVDLRLSTLDFGALDESGGIAFLGSTGQETSTYGLSQWMKLEKERLTLEPGKSQDVKVTVDNRESLSPGGHYGAVIVSDETTENSPDSLSLVPATSTLVLLKKSGGEIQELNLESQNTNNSLINLPKSADLRFQNTGNVHLVPRGTVELFSPTGSLISKGLINPNSSYILPESFRIFTVDFSGTSQPWLPGRYRMETTWRYDGIEESEEVVTTHYWYAGKLLIYLTLALSTVIVLIMFRKWRNRPIFRGQ